MKLDEMVVFEPSGWLAGDDSDYEDAIETVSKVVADIFRVSAPFRKSTDRGGVFLLATNTVDNPDMQNEEEAVKDPRTGKMTIAYLLDSDLRCNDVVGEVEDGQVESVRQEARDNAVRLLEMYDSQQHYTSWLSRNKRANTGMGAIITKGYVLSFAGCDQMTNDMVVICVALVTGLCSQADAEYVATISGNEMVRQVMEAMRTTSA